MVKKVEDGYVCSICGTIYERDTYALSCEQSHGVVYVPFKGDELFRLLQFIITKDEKLLSKELIDTLYKYSNRILANRKVK